MFSLGIEPSMTSTYAASNSPRAAARNGFRNSSPPSDGSSTLLCRCTFGSPGMSPSTTSSIAGRVPAVIETVSPSQLIPSEIQRMCTSSTPGDGWISWYPGDAGAPTSLPPRYRDWLVLELECVHVQLVAGDHVDVQAAAARARERKLVSTALGRAAPARHAHRH